MNALDVLRERGFVAQVTFEDELYKKLDQEHVTFYCGFDPTADSLHVGHYIPIMAMSHLQKAGHKPIALVGGGTAMVGDPSGRNSMRNMLTPEDIAENCRGLAAQLGRFLSFEGPNAAIMSNNADWLMKLNYVDFLREVGTHFSVNRMLTADCYKNRMEQGLTFLEFNYMLMQSYDFYRLQQDYGCVMQVGGDDQWSNMLAGADLIRRKAQAEAYTLTFRLLLNSQGEKMGKTAGGAVWLDEKRTPPYAFYQYWRNIEDASVERCLAMLTFLPMDEVRRLGKLEGAEINHAKTVLAYEMTKLVHGEDAAAAARDAASALFGKGGQQGSVPEVTIQAQAELSVVDALMASGLAGSKGEARRLIQGGGAYVEGEKVTAVDAMIPQSLMDEKTFMLRKGKKDFCRVTLAD